MWRQEVGGNFRTVSAAFGSRRPFSMRFAMVFGGRGSKTRFRGPFSLAKTNRKLTCVSCRVPHHLHLPFRCLFAALLAASLRLQKRRKRKDHSPKKFSALRPARQDTACAFSTTPASKNSPQASKTQAFLGVPGGGSRASQEASETAPRGQAPQAPRPAPQEAILAKT